MQMIRFKNGGLPLCFLGLIGFSTHAMALDASDPSVQPGLTLQPIISETGTWGSNPLLATSNAKALYGSTTAPELIVMDKTDTKEITLDQLVDQNFFNDPNFNSTDFHSKNKFMAKNQRWTAGIAGGIDYDTTRTSEISVFGSQIRPVRHFGYSATPQMTFNVNPTDVFGLSGNVSGSTYHGATSASFTDYNVYSVTPSYTHNFDPLNAGIFQVKAQRYQAAEGPKNISNTVTPTIGWIGELTPRFKAQANVGAQLTKQDAAGTASKPWSTDLSFSGDLTFTGEQDKTDLTFSRQATPFGNGTDSLLTSVALKENHRLNERFTLNASASYQFAEYQTTTPSNFDSLASAGGGLTYSATEHVDITGSYLYRYETLTNISKSPDDHSVNLQVVYHPEAWLF